MPERTRYTKFGYTSDETETPLTDNQTRRSLIDTYREVWRQDPYDEHFTIDEVETELVEYRHELPYRGYLAIDARTDRVIGFAYGFRLTSEIGERTDWRKLKLKQRTHSHETRLEDMFDGQTFYFEEFGVAPDRQNRGIGAELYRRLEETLVADESFDRIALMTTTENWVVDAFYTPRGFEWSGITIPIRQERTDGSIQTDLREWLTKDI